MSRLVFDSSAILVLFYNEPGKKKVRSLIERHEALMSSVNLCEVLSKLKEDDLDLDEVIETLGELELEIISFDKDLAERTAELRPETKRFGLSLGDRACLALAISQKASAVTADKNWQKQTHCEVELIR